MGAADLVVTSEAPLKKGFKEVEGRAVPQLGGGAIDSPLNRSLKVSTGNRVLLWEQIVRPTSDCLSSVDPAARSDVRKHPTASQLALKRG